MKFLKWSDIRIPDILEKYSQNIIIIHLHSLEKSIYKKKNNKG